MTNIQFFAIQEQIPSLCIFAVKFETMTKIPDCTVPYNFFICPGCQKTLDPDSEPDPHWQKSRIRIRIETYADPHHCKNISILVFSLETA